MEMTNGTHLSCDPCILNFFDLYPLILALPSAFTLPIKGLVFWTQASTPLTEKTDLLTLSIFFVDFLLSISTIVTASSLLLHSSFFTYSWGILIGFLSIGHPLFQSLICVERYFAVEHPIIFLKYRPLRYRCALLAAAWTITIVGSATTAGLCSFDSKYTLGYLCFECVFLLVIITVNSFSCLAILRKLIQPTPGDKNQNGTRKKDGKDVKMKAFFIVLGVQCNILICYLPPISVFLSAPEVLHRRFCSIYLFNIWFIVITSGMHSLMYLHHQGKLKTFKCSQKT